MPKFDHRTKVIMAETRKRAAYDPFVHSVTALVVQVLNIEHRETMGMTLSKREQDIARIAATMALTLIEKDPTDGSSVIERTITESSPAALRKMELSSHD